MLRYFKILLKAKYSFLPPTKSDVLVFDLDSKEIINKIFIEKKINFLETRKKYLNLFIVFKTFLQFKFGYFDYILNYIKLAEPKLIITSIDNNKDFYRIKKYFPTIITIFFQNGHRTGGLNDIFTILEKKNLKEYKKIYNVDLMCVFNKMTADLYKKFITGNTFVSGSVKSNYEKISKKKKTGLIFVSLFRTSRKPFHNEIKLISLLKIFCKKNRLKLKILGKYKDTYSAIREKNFYLDILKKDFFFIKNFDSRKSYKYLDASKIVVSSGSTMGLESLGRENKTALIHTMPNKNPYRKSFWGYFTNRKDNGFFWTHQASDKNNYKILINLRDIQLRKWKNKIKKFAYETCIYDYKNIKLKKKIVKFCKTRKFNVTPFISTFKN